ncbi:LacI family DNA-binding transcriptional regulator [Roseicitreum antarcticum]|uniref:Transcriptional regulator, LacI family n=1 Tax=Roseicitreum antarcticum TaxID=564137 RepID=A0A1H2R6F4_9RHOB|nr:LacI family DNA-binding transcriptional regulator [Roseicitreum antarcticum]SDW15043.1 transcriptional regulator, LacI family [Roseicitreum antarcticum]
MRPTTKDLAQAAGVSLATVDRVLNARPGVRQKTVDAVNEAIQRIGFERNLVAATLARKKGYTFGFVLPRKGDEFMAEILHHIRESHKAGRAEMAEIKALRLDEQDPHKTAEALNRLTLQEVDGVAIMAPQTPPIRDAIRRMRERGIRVVPFIANQQDGGATSFVGIDNIAAGATAGQLMGRFAGGRAGAVAVMTDTIQARDSLERRLGFDNVINQMFPRLNVLPSLETHTDPDRTHRIITKTFETQHDLVGLYIMGSEARVPVEAMRRFPQSANLIAIAHERTPATVAALRQRTLDAVVTQDPGHLVRSAVRILRAECENRVIVASQEKIRIEILLAENL